MEAIKRFLQGQWLKHPLHPALVHVPVAVWPAALVFDLLTRLGNGSQALVQTSYYAILLGLVMVIGAVPTGLADWSGIKRDKPAWKLGLYHMLLNVAVAGVWAVNLGLRVGTFRSAEVVAAVPLTLSLLGTLLLFVSSYLGGQMVYAYGISVARHSKAKWRRIADKGGARLPEK